jgi:hypothetical protein
MVNKAPQRHRQTENEKSWWEGRLCRQRRCVTGIFNNHNKAPWRYKVHMYPIFRLDTAKSALVESFAASLLHNCPRYRCGSGQYVVATGQS